jgi:hypothetical protein
MHQTRELLQKVAAAQQEVAVACARQNDRMFKAWSSWPLLVDKPEWLHWFAAGTMDVQAMLLPDERLELFERYEGLAAGKDTLPTLTEYKHWPGAKQAVWTLVLARCLYPYIEQSLTEATLSWFIYQAGADEWSS